MVMTDKKIQPDENEVVFYKSGHNWNDPGVMGLWWTLCNLASPEQGPFQDGDRQVIKAIYSDDDVCVLYSDRLEVKKDTDGSVKILDKAIQELRKEVWRPTKNNKEWWFGPASFLYAGQNKVEVFLPIFKEFAKKSQWKKGMCDVCNNESFPVRTTGTGYNPFLVSVNKMSGFYSELKGGYKICQTCAFAAPFSLTEIWYSFGNQFLSLNVLWPTSDSFLLLDSFLRKTSSSRISDSDFRNYRQSFAYAESPVACFLELMCSLWDLLRESSSLNEIEEDLGKIQFHVMQMTKPNTRSNVINIDRYQIIPDPINVFRLVKQAQTTRQGKTWNTLISVLYNLPIRRRGPDGTIQANSILLNEFAEAVVKRLPVEGILEKRIYEALDQLKSDQGQKQLEQFNTMAIRLFLERTYFKEVEHQMPEEFLKATKSVGETLGEVIAKTDDRSILYTLRNARNEDDLLEVLSRAIVRHSETFIKGKPEGVELYRASVRTLAETINRQNWRRARSLLSLYAGLKYIDLKQRANKTNQPSTTSNP